MDLFYFTENM